jgi:L-asparaginase/Glu-tRNA(Gln) amidotransferase subunit D
MKKKNKRIVIIHTGGTLVMPSKSSGKGIKKLKKADDG